VARTVCALPGISVTPRTRDSDQATRVRAGGLVPSGSSAVGAAAVPSEVTDAAGASGSVVGCHVAALLPGSIHKHVAIPSPTIGVSPGVSGWSTENMLAELLGRYDSFDCASLSRFESLLTADLRATRPSIQERGQPTLLSRNGSGNRACALAANAAPFSGRQRRSSRVYRQLRCRPTKPTC